ncbi:PstS family phosphate ABC transporter substrate-binding protein [Thaumasiovibrio sp. DFM-14]|uniref:PstS family phosphate ABC transporter substrate-binding protein n=1 Tax=Thaumasiovibrio sp. DFM-14 TaxID=3384792 RepID=UPI00399F088D
MSCMKKLKVALVASCLLSSSHVWALNDTLPAYHKVAGISGSLSSMGSDTLSGLMTMWAEEFNRYYPNIMIEIQSAGSSTAPTALTEATTQFGPMSRPMHLREIDAFEREFGYKPTAIRVAIDALAVFVHQDNPLQGLNFQQLDAIFSRTLHCGASQQITQWADLGLDGIWRNRDIQLFGRNSVSGTYGYFKQKALCRGDFVARFNEQPGSASVVQSISTSLNSIGFSGIGYTTSAVRPLAIAELGDDYIEASMENIASGEYPLSRFLYVYINKHPSQPLGPLENEFVRFILSEQGQQLVAREGYVPLPSNVAVQERERLGL